MDLPCAWSISTRANSRAWLSPDGSLQCERFRPGTARMTGLASLAKDMWPQIDALAHSGTMLSCFCSSPFCGRGGRSQVAEVFQRVLGREAVVTLPARNGDQPLVQMAGNAVGNPRGRAFGMVGGHDRSPRWRG